MRAASSFTINGLNFNPARIDTTVRLGDIEDWEFINTSAMDHPMHIHTDPFQLVYPDGTVERAWRDIVTVPAYGRAKIRTQFLDYPGKTFYHCHILDHEDRGMMGILAIGSKKFLPRTPKRPGLRRVPAFENLVILLGYFTSPRAILTRLVRRLL